MEEKSLLVEKDEEERKIRRHLAIVNPSGGNKKGVFLLNKHVV